MTPDPAAYDELLAAYDEALDTGAPLPSAPGDSDQLARDLGCLYRLHRWKSVRAPSGPAREVGRFQIRRELGRGGFGVVYLAFDPRLGRDVALKLPRPDVLTSDELRERFHREARAAAGLDHPNVVPVFEAGEAGPACYIASAYCPGPTLREWLRGRADPVPVADAAALVASLADGVGHAHARGVVHRDQKPANVLQQSLTSGSVDDTPLPARLMSDPPTCGFTPRVTDFGLAKLADPAEAMTRSGAMMGTPSYMAPEQASGQPAGPAADVYSLGAVLYELLTGRPPFTGESDLEMLDLVRNAEPVAPSQLRPRLPRDLETVCLRCLEKDPRRRYPNAAELAADLRRFLTGEPVKARRVGALGKTWKWARRRPLVAGLLVVVAALTVGGAAAITVLWRQTEAARERTVAELAAKQAALARIEWEAGQLDRAAGYLRECPEAYRDGEWQYLDRMCRAHVTSFPCPTEHNLRVAYSPDGRVVASAGPRGVTAWNVASRTIVFTSAHPLNFARPKLGFTPNGRRLVVASQILPSPSTQVARPKSPPLEQAWQFAAWDVATGRLVDHAKVGSNVARVTEYSAAGPLRASDEGDLIRVKNLLSGETVEFAHGHTKVRYLQFSAGGRYLLSIARGEPLKVWDVTTGRLVSTASARSLLRYDAVREQLSPDGRRLIQLGPSDDVDAVLIKVWDLEQDRELATIRVSRLQLGEIRSCPDGRHLALVDGRAVRVWDLAHSREVLVLRGHTERVIDIAFAPHGRRLVSVGLDQAVRVWAVTPSEE